jgi:hypothetical protein
MKTAVTLLIFLDITLSVGQWSQPVTLAESIAPFGAGPELVPLSGDTIWVFWVHEDMTPRLMARRFAANNWDEPETLAIGLNGLYWPAGIVNDSNRLLVAFYEGSYPVEQTTFQDSWGIYTMKRTEAGWTQPNLAHNMLMTAFPYEIRLGRDRNGGIGMVWDENAGGMNSMDSVMFSRKTSSGWTPRRCLAPGRYPDVNCSHASLIPGDSTNFIISFWNWTYPNTNLVEVWDLNDSLMYEAQVFAGEQPVLSRSDDSRFLIFRRKDSLFGSVNWGMGWMTEELIASGLGWGTPGLCSDAMGWAWTCWPDSFQQVVLTSYNSGMGWSYPETVARFSSLGEPRIASDDSGVIYCVWLDHAAGNPGRLRHAYRLARPGIMDEYGQTPKSYPEHRPTIVRGILKMPLASGIKHSASSVLFDISGRKILDLQPGPNDVSRLAHGVYFVRLVPEAGWTTVKVVIQK